MMEGSVQIMTYPDPDPRGPKLRILRIWIRIHNTDTVLYALFFNEFNLNTLTNELHKDCFMPFSCPRCDLFSGTDRSSTNDLPHFSWHADIIKGIQMAPFTCTFHSFRRQQRNLKKWFLSFKEVIVFLPIIGPDHEMDIFFKGLKSWIRTFWTCDGGF
jgi:hypothetical protein